MIPSVHLEKLLQPQDYQKTQLAMYSDADLHPNTNVNDSLWWLDPGAPLCPPTWPKVQANQQREHGDFECKQEQRAKKEK